MREELFCEQWMAGFLPEGGKEGCHACNGAKNNTLQKLSLFPLAPSLSLASCFTFFTYLFFGFFAMSMQLRS